ncbi:hypothetical protein ACWD4O_41275 [Streptomyces sp. NPDC002623]
MHAGGQHAPSLRGWVWTAGALVYGRWLLARNRLAPVRLGRYLLFLELLLQILFFLIFFLIADGAVGSWFAGIWSGSPFGAGLPGGLLLVALALSGRWATAHLISGGSRWAFAGPRGWALAIANLVNYVYPPLFRPVPLSAGPSPSAALTWRSETSGPVLQALCRGPAAVSVCQ